MNRMQPSRSSRPPLLKAPSASSRARPLAGNELGQMSIFLALVFQVLFVFFAMVINIGLLVHDKINLQNSVDLGAYYAAQKQAEILNEIAHINYQIRQDYKLLAWRYWVLGTLGRDGQGSTSGSQQPPARRTGSIPVDRIRLYATENGVVQEEVPVACLATPMWWEFALLSPGRAPNENYCWHSYNWVSPAIPVPSAPMTPATAGVNAAAQMFANVSINNFVGSCVGASPLSWAFVAAIMTDYKFSIAMRKRAIRKLRENLVSANPTDREGKSIREGVIQTIQKNLTESNLQSFNSNAVQMLNGLTKGGCAGGNSIYPGAQTMPEILTAPGLYFALLRGVAPRCEFDIRFQTQFGDVQGGVANWDPNGLMQSLVRNEPGPDDDYHSTLGFEKNPWCMAYMGVKASTSPRKPFAPFGKSVNLVARAFAQPFGGRIGPWYSKRWVKGAPTSNEVAQPTPNLNPVPGATPALNPVAGQEDRTDPLTSPRISPGAGGYTYSSYTIPNYSRFPGDPLGMRSELAQSTARLFFQQTQFASAASTGSFADNRVRLNWFYGFGLMNATGDSLAFDTVQAAAGQQPPEVMRFRNVEIAAVAPDLFDITYYSIDPEANVNYIEPAKRNPARYGLTSAPAGDLGSRQDVPDMRVINVQSQIATAFGAGLDPLLRPVVYWLVRDWKHLLTSWAPHRVTNFGFPTDRFGDCRTEALATAMIPGKCAAGGRIGYSVRLIARDHLNGQWQIGGDGEPAGPILNPPGDDIEF